MRYFLLTLFALLLSGCGFQLRGTGQLPPQLNRLYIASDHPYSPITTHLNSALNSAGSTIVKKPSQAHYRLVLSNESYTHSQPNFNSTDIASSYTYTYSIAAKITTNKGKTVVPSKTFSASRDVVLNTNQVLIADTSSNTQRELSRELTSLVYEWLASGNVHKALATTTKTPG